MHALRCKKELELKIESCAPKSMTTSACNARVRISKLSKLNHIPPSIRAEPEHFKVKVKDLPCRGMGNL